LPLRPCQNTISIIVSTTRPTADRTSPPAGERHEQASVEVPRTRPVERFWPYADLPEQPTDEEIAALDPDLHAALFGAPPRPFSITLVFPRFDAPDYARAVDLAKASAEYGERGQGSAFRHRARFWSSEASRLRDLFDIVGRFDDCEVLIDDRPLPYARELWLPLVWLTIA
jgi:hypothetical protein